LEVTCT